MDKYNRSQFYNNTTVNGLVEADLLMTLFDKFETKRPVSFYKIKDVDIARPELLSFKFYEKIHYYWILMAFNKIEDPYNDLTVDDIIRIPSELDIEDFYTSVRKQLTR